MKHTTNMAKHRPKAELRSSLILQPYVYVTVRTTSGGKGNMSRIKSRKRGRWRRGGNASGRKSV